MGQNDLFHHVFLTVLLAWLSMSQCSALGKKKKGTERVQGYFSPGAKDWLQSHTLSPCP